MGKAIFRFYEELNDDLPPGKRKRDFEVAFQGKKTAQEMIEKLGVSPAKVDLLLVNGQSMNLDYVVEEGDRISVYPVFERLNIKGVSRVRGKPLRRLKFIVDKDLGGLAESLQEMGLDVIFGEDLVREQILRMVKEGGRILLTQRGDPTGSQGLDRMIVLKPGSLHEQVDQVIHALDLRDELR
jgi:sulfur carrier protein ThiS